MLLIFSFYIEISFVITFFSFRREFCGSHITTCSTLNRALLFLIRTMMCICKVMTQKWKKLKSSSKMCKLKIIIIVMTLANITASRRVAKAAKTEIMMMMMMKTTIMYMWMTMSLQVHHTSYRLFKLLTNRNNWKYKSKDKVDNNSLT